MKKLFGALLVLIPGMAIAMLAPVSDNDISDDAINKFEEIQAISYRDSATRSIQEYNSSKAKLYMNFIEKGGLGETTGEEFATLIDLHNGILDLEPQERGDFRANFAGFIAIKNKLAKAFLDAQGKDRTWIRSTLKNIKEAISNDYGKRFEIYGKYLPQKTYNL